MNFYANIYIFTMIKMIQAQMDPITIQVQPDDLVNTFQSIVTSDYVQKMANQFAVKAAEKFMKELLSRQNNINMNSLRFSDGNVERDSIDGNKKKKILLGKQQALNLQDDFRLPVDNLKKENMKENMEKPSMLSFKKTVVQSEDSRTSAIDVKEKSMEEESKEKSDFLSEEQAMTLLDEPSPDGDNLDDDRLLSDAEEKQPLNKSPMPVVEVARINGRYFRRFLEMI